MTKARDLADYTGLQADLAGLQTNITAGDTAARAGRKNLIINGGFDVAQRGTSFTGTQIYTLDRWYMDESGSTTTLTQETHTLGQTDVPDNPKYYLKMNTTTGANNCRIEQNIEGVHHAAGQSATLSFWAKGVNPAGGNYNINMNQLFGTGGSPSTETSVSLGTFTVTSSWVKKSFTVTLASISGKTLGTNLGTDHLKLQILQPDGDGGSAAWNLNISNIQFELGSVATDFEHRSYGEELALCQRYFQKWDGAPSRRWAFNGMILGTGDSYGVYFLKTTMRANPVLVTSGTASDYCLYAGNALFTCSTVPTITNGSVETPQINFKASGMTDGRASMCGSNTDNGSLSFNSEL